MDPYICKNTLDKKKSQICQDLQADSVIFFNGNQRLIIST